MHDVIQVCEAFWVLRVVLVYEVFQYMRCLSTQGVPSVELVVNWFTVKGVSVNSMYVHHQQSQLTLLQCDSVSL